MYPIRNGIDITPEPEWVDRKHRVAVLTLGEQFRCTASDAGTVSGMSSDTVHEYILLPAHSVMCETQEEVQAEGYISNISNLEELGVKGILVTGTERVPDGSNIPILISNLSSVAATLVVGMRICSISFQDYTLGMKDMVYPDDRGWVLMRYDGRPEDLIASVFRSGNTGTISVSSLDVFGRYYEYPKDNCGSRRYIQDCAEAHIVRSAIDFRYFGVRVQVWVSMLDQEISIQSSEVKAFCWTLFMQEFGLV